MSHDLTTGARTAAHDAVARALAWSDADQGPAGEITAWASPLDGTEPAWAPDTLNFVTALAVLALDRLDHPRAVAIVDRAVDLLIREQQPNGLWRYWAAGNDQTDLTPADADDTACAALAIATRGRTCPGVADRLLANRDPDGRFLTWFLPRPGSGVRLRWTLRDERHPAVRARRRLLWETTEAEPDDVDAVVNANACRYLGPAAPDEAARWVTSLLRAGREAVADKWHRNATTFHLSVADGARRGVRPFAEVEGLVVDRIASSWAGGGIVHPLDRAQSLLALQAYDARPELRREIAAALTATQRADGSWARSTFYYGGPREVFGWASEALATAYAAAALHAEATP